MKGLQALLIYLLCSTGIFTSTGCSVFMAAKQPRKMDLTLLRTGTARTRLLAEFGQPAWSETKDGKKVDMFSFRQGYSKAAKTGRALFHGVADVMTLGLWEVVGTPTEMIFDGTKMAYEVTYDAEDRVEKIKEVHPQQD